MPASAQTSARNDELKFNADYFLMRQEFGKAIDLYLDVLKSEPDNADIKHRIGICYLNSEDEKEKAIPYLEEAVKKVSRRYNVKSFKETNAPIEAYFLLGSAYRVNNRLEEAIEAYKKYQEFLDPGDDYNRQATDQYISSCQVAREMQQNPKDVRFINLGRPVNNTLANFNAVISGDGKKLIFTSPGRQGYDIYQSMLTDSGWSEPSSISPMLGKGKYMKTCYLSQDGTTLILVLEDPEDSQLFFSRETRGRWSRAEIYPKPVNSTYNETHASLSRDGRTIYFTSNRKGGEGDLDIYQSTMQEGVWGRPQNLGPKINTPYNEETPFVSVDGSILYFSSEGYKGMGGYDVYRYDFTHPDAGVVNLGYPINTTDNNLFYMPFRDGSTGYYAFRGADSYGGRDIYQVNIIPEVIPQAVAIMPAPVQDTTPVVVPEIPVLTEPETTEIIIEKVPQDTIPVVHQEVPQAIAQSPVPDVKQEAAPETVPVPALEVPTETVPVALQESPQETVPVVHLEVPQAIAQNPVPEVKQEAAPEKVKIHVPEVTHKPVESSPGIETNESMERAYTVQFMALRKRRDLQYFTGLTDILVTYTPDAWHRYTWITTTDSLQAVRIREDLVRKGYTDAFIRKKSFVGYFAIQVMAVPGPVIDLTLFSNLPDISVTRGGDTFGRYTTGSFRSKEEAGTELERVRALGYKDAFVRRVRILR